MWSIYLSSGANEVRISFHISMRSTLMYLLVYSHSIYVLGQLSTACALMRVDGMNKHLATKLYLVGDIITEVDLRTLHW